jgi:hypothetical protein
MEVHLLTTVTRTVTPEKTDGLSPKTILAAVLPSIGTVLAILIQWVVTGELNRPELVTALVGFSGALLSVIGAYLGAPGAVVVRLNSERGYSLVELVVAAFFAVLLLIAFVALLDHV